MRKNPLTKHTWSITQRWHKFDTQYVKRTIRQINTVTSNTYTSNQLLTHDTTCTVLKITQSDRIDMKYKTPHGWDTRLDLYTHTIHDLTYTHTPYKPPSTHTQHTRCHLHTRYKTPPTHTHHTRRHLHTHHQLHTPHTWPMHPSHQLHTYRINCTQNKNEIQDMRYNTPTTRTWDTNPATRTWMRHMRYKTSYTHMTSSTHIWLRLHTSHHINNTHITTTTNTAHQMPTYDTNYISTTQISRHAIGIAM